MPFDPKTAKRVGFDPTTAAPVEQESMGAGLVRTAKNFIADQYRGATSLPSAVLNVPIAINNAVASTFSPGGYEVKYGNNPGHRTGILPSSFEQQTNALKAIGMGPDYRNPAEEVLGAVNRGIGSTLLPIGLGSAAASGPASVTTEVGKQLTAQPLSQIAAGAGSGASSEAVRQMGGGPLAQMAAGLLGGVLTGSAVGRFENAAPKPPSVEALKEKANAAYKSADESGFVIPKEKISGMADDIEKAVNKLGYDKELNPEIASALRRVREDSSKDLTLSQMETLRKVVKQAFESDKPSTQKMAYTMVNKLDEVIGSIPGQTLSEARNLWSRVSKAEEIQQLMKNAGIRGQRNVSLTGYEQGLRTEFGKIALNPDRLKLYSPAEQEAIIKVATGGSMLSPANLTRYVGKFAPTNNVSTVGGAGLGYLLGGPTGAVAVPAVGMAGRLAATGLASRNANLALELMRRGQPLPQAWMFPQQNVALAAALAAQGK